MTETLNKSSDSPINVDPKLMYGSLTKESTPAKDNEILADTDPNQIPEADREEFNIDDREEWRNLKTRWDNLGVVYERLNQCAEVLSDEGALFGIQQLNNALNFIGNAKVELEKAFNYECNAIAVETKIPNMLEAPWGVSVKSKPRKNKESVFLHEEVVEE